MGKFDRYFREMPLEAKATSLPSAAVAGLPDGHWVGEGVYRIERRYPFDKRYGAFPLKDPNGMHVMRAFGAAPGNLVFLDLETTGLAGGSGTYAFLCGLGRTAGDAFEVLQFFLVGPAREGDWLRAIDAEIPRDACIVTYNGKTFDLPLLRTRHVLARSVPVWDHMPHVDLLHLARRLYRGRFDSCSLGSMEQNVLGVARSGEDIPGALIPALYMQYLRTKDASPLGGVFYHNELDIVSLAAFYGHVARVLDGETGCGREFLRAGDAWHAVGHSDRSLRYWSVSCEYPEVELGARIRRAQLAKRESDFSSAREDFARALELIRSGRHCDDARTTVFSLCEELAKLEEHKFSDPDRAMTYAADALEWLKRNRYLLGGSFAPMQRALLHRMTRLQKKRARRTDSEPA